MESMAIYRYVLIISSYCLVESANILFIIPVPSYSHQTPALSLAQALIERGHHITYVGTERIPDTEGRFTYVDVSSAYKTLLNLNDTGSKRDNLKGRMSRYQFARSVISYFKIAQKELESKEFKTFEREVKSTKKQFDVVIIEPFFYRLHVPMAYILAGPKPVIGLNTMAMEALTEPLLGTKTHYSFVPHVLQRYSDRMSVWQKMENWFSSFWTIGVVLEDGSNVANSFFRQNYGPEMEIISKNVQNNISLVLTTSNFLYFYPRTLSPNLIEVGPLHIKQPQKLPQDIQTWLDGGEKGAIYLSLGSSMKSISLPDSVRESLNAAFKELSGYRVLWKWESDEVMPNKSSNVFTKKWIPQQSVLAHPKVKVFITQGGMQSFQEAVHFGVPTIGIPYFSDQELNVKKMVTAEVGVELPVEYLYNPHSIRESIQAVLFDERYARNMAKLSCISRDFTEKSVETSVWWIEHVIKHGHANHLRPVTAGISYFEFFCLDILAVILATIIIFTYLTYNVFKYISHSLQSWAPAKKQKEV